MAVLIVTLKKLEWRGYASSLAEVICRAPEINSDVSRDAFATTNVDRAPLVHGHTHATAAALRTSATNFARNMATYTGCNLYIVGMSKSDQRKGLRGSRQWYWAKDTNADNRSDEPAADDIEFICDVDYYLDMRDILSRRAKPTLLYTVVPEAASTNEDGTSTQFDEDGALHTLVAGGGSYRHFLWDYATDSILCVSKFLGIPIRVITYAVERKQVGAHRQVILLTPIRDFGGLSAILAYFLLEGKELSRFNPIVDAEDGSKFVRFVVHTSTGTKVTTARTNSQLCATVPAEVDEAIGTVARLGTTKLMLPTTASWTGNDARMEAAVLTEFHRLAQPKVLPVVYPVSVGVRSYQYEPCNYDPEAKAKLAAFMSPLVHGAFSPVANAAGERRCVEGRINGLRSEEPRPHAFRDQCIAEFAELIVQGMILEPVCYEVVKDKQTSAAQKISLEKATVWGTYRKTVLKCFIKAEAYSNVKDPRNISAYNDADKLDMAQFALALAEYCKRFSWYGPGKTPLEIAERVSEICQNSREYVNISDYHRMDGTITYVLRQVDRAVCMKAFPNHRTKLNELLKTNVDNKGYLPNGTTFDQGPSHGSGCSATSLFQTLRAAFTAYLAFRHAPLKCGRKRTPREAFDAIGCHLGDDGIDADLPPGAHLWAANKVGLKLEADIVSRGNRGVNFLARYYSPEVWTGCLDSMCDAKRQLSKFHTTVRLPNTVTPAQKLVEKCMSYVATDSNTPVIGEYCKRVLLLSQIKLKTLLGLGNWWSKFEDSVQYPNSNANGWMDVEFSTLFPEFDRSVFSEWMAKTKSFQDLLEAPLCAEPVTATPTVVDVVVDGEVLKALPAKSEAPTPKKQRKKKKERKIKRMRRVKATSAEEPTKEISPEKTHEIVDKLVDIKPKSTNKNVKPIQLRKVLTPTK